MCHTLGGESAGRRFEPARARPPVPSPAATESARRVSFTRAELKSFTGATLPDLIGDGLRLLFVGINPGLRSVAVQPEGLNDAQMWVVPNPSGRNAHAPLDTLAAAYREVAVAAGVPVRRQP